MRDQPYLPLYVQDYLTDEKLNECSPASQGVYIKIMCVMHKSEEYGVILLKQKHKQKESSCLSFATQLANHLPFTIETINTALEELIFEKVLRIDGDKLIQKRMVKDNHISEIRSKAGSKGGKFAQANAKAKMKANSEYENEYENEYKDKKIPTQEEAIQYAKKRAVMEFPDMQISDIKITSLAKEFYNHYTEKKWKDGNGNKVKNWKNKLGTWILKRNTQLKDWEAVKNPDVIKGSI